MNPTDFGDDYTFGVQYEALNAAGADPADPASWSEYVIPVDSLLSAVETREQFRTVYADNNDIRNIEAVFTPKVHWTVYADGDPPPPPLDTPPAEPVEDQAVVEDEPRVAE